MTTVGIQPNTWLQQLPSAIRDTVDGNRDGQIETTEVVDFLEQLLAAVKATPNATFETNSGGSVVTKPTPLLAPGATEIATTSETPTGLSGWRSFVFGNSSSGNYAGVMVAPSRDVPSGYQTGAFRHQLEGFNHSKFDPTHAEGMTLKMIAGRVFEQFDVYSDTAIDDVVAAFNELGIPATKVGLDTIDFGNGEGPIDIQRNAAWLDGDKSAGMAWQWAPVNDGAQPMNFTMSGVAAPLAGQGGSSAVAGPTGTTGTTGTKGTTGVGGSTGSTLYPGTVDQIDLGAVDWLHANVSSWPVTSAITDVQIGASTISIDHSKSGQWPTLNYNGIAVEGNPWVFVNRNGQWHGATYEWLRPGQTEKGVTADGIGDNIKLEPLASWTPQPGELVGFMVSTPARDENRTSNERTNVVLRNWPA